MRYDKTDHGIMVQVAEGAVTDDEWRKLLDYMSANRKVLRAVAVFVHSNSGLTAKQRSALADVIKTLRPGFRTAVLTESQVARGILTALNWLTKKQEESKAFPLTAFDEALSFLGANDEEARAARELAQRLGVFNTLGRTAAR